MSHVERRTETPADRRRMARGGRRDTDRPGKFPNVLLADSYDAARRPCARYLDLLNFHVREAAEGHEAIAQIQASHPHLILVERALPSMDAAQISDWLQQHPDLRSVPIIVLTTEFERREGLELPSNVAGVLVKPFPLTTMIEEIRRVLRSLDRLS